MESYGKKFKEKLLSEAKKKVGKRESIEPDSKVAKSGGLAPKSKELASFFPAAADQAIISLIVSLGAPVSALELHKSELRDSIVSSSKLYKKDSTFKMWVTKLTNSLELLSVSPASEVKEQTDFGKQLTGRYQREVYDVMVALGLPETITSTAARALKSGIKNAATVITDDSSIRMFFASAAERLGISAGAETTTKKGSKVSEAIDTERDAGEVISRLLTALGVNGAENVSIERQMMRSEVRRKLLKVQASGILISRLNAIVHSIEEKTIIFAANVPTSTGKPGEI